MNGINPDTSRLIYNDLQEAMSDWMQADEVRSAWRMQQILFLQALLPVTIYLEQAGDDLECACIVKLEELERRLRMAKARHGKQLELVASQLQRCLQLLPAYQLANGELQPKRARDHWVQLVSMMRNVRAAALPIPEGNGILTPP